jgi:hypothetical protein
MHRYSVIGYPTAAQVLAEGQGPNGEGIEILLCCVPLEPQVFGMSGEASTLTQSMTTYGLFF